MDWVPKPYQLDAVKFLVEHANCGLFLDPGMGKTSTTLTGVSLFRAKSAVRAVLIIVPIRPMYMVWPEEIKKWSHVNHLSYTILHGDDKDKRVREQSDIYLINPEGLKWFMSIGGMDIIKPDMLVIDESTKFKDSQTARFKLLKPFLSRFKRRLILTGEPAPNGYEDLFGQMFLVDQGASLGRFITHYRSQYFYQESWDQYSYHLREGADIQIQEKIKPVVMRLAAEDHLEMPELVINDIMVELDPKSRKIYKELEDNFLAEIDGQFVMSTSAAAMSSKCRQVANGGVYSDDYTSIHVHDHKTAALVDLVEQLSGQPLLVSYEFKHDIERIMRALPQTQLITGVTGPKLDRMVNDFNEGKIPVLLGHPMSAGHGLNLQGSCHHVCYYGLTWDLDGYHQLYKRVWRQGQKSPRVIVHRILANKTLDQRVARVLHDKDFDQSALLRALRDS